jgi:Zn ribbon nucleic-acid-binding protein
MKVEIYWCVNCGHKSKAKRIDQTTCDNCGYVGITPYEISEIMEDKNLIERFKECLDEDPPVPRS